MANKTKTHKVDSLPYELTFPPSWEPQTHCGFCYEREQGTHGEIKREWSPDWRMFIPVCRKHALCDGMIDGIENQGPML